MFKNMNINLNERIFNNKLLKVYYHIRKINLREKLIKKINL